MALKSPFDNVHYRVFISEFQVICHIHSDLEILPVDQHLPFRSLAEDKNITKRML